MKNFYQKHKKIETHCKKCGQDLYYRVDGNNGAITRNAKGFCKNKNCKNEYIQK